MQLNKRMIEVNKDTILQDWGRGNIVVENKKQAGAKLCQGQGQVFSCFELFLGSGEGILM